MPWSLQSSTSAWSGFGCTCVSAPVEDPYCSSWLLLYSFSAWHPGPFRVWHSVSCLSDVVDTKVLCLRESCGWRCLEQEAAWPVSDLQRGGGWVLKRSKEPWVEHQRARSLFVQTSGALLCNSSPFPAADFSWVL